MQVNLNVDMNKHEQTCTPNAHIVLPPVFMLEWTPTPSAKQPRRYIVTSTLTHALQEGVKYGSSFEVEELPKTRARIL